MSRAREASRAAAVRPWTRPGPQATAARRARRFSTRSSSSSSLSSSTCVARGVRAKRDGIAPCHAFIARACARSAAWHDGRCGARGRRGQALVDAKARFRVRAFATARRLRGRRNLFGGRAACGPGGRSGRPLAAEPRGTQLNRVRPSRDLACERPRCGVARRPPSAGGPRRAGASRGVTARGGGPRRRDP